MNDRDSHCPFYFLDSLFHNYFRNNPLNNLWYFYNFLNDPRNHHNFLDNFLDFHNFRNFYHFFNDFFNWHFNFFNSVDVLHDFNYFLLDIRVWLGNFNVMIDNCFNFMNFRLMNNNGSLNLHLFYYGVF